MTSPFKFLDPYEKRDKAIFFGRDDEIEALYKLVFQTNLVLVYGTSGTGKTSLIQCGLANRFKATDWFEIFVRRKDNINASLDREVRRLATTPIDAGASIVEAVQSLFLDHLRPIYLIFDQFEELFIFGSPEEQAALIGSVKALVEADVACKVIISMREEYLAQLQDFEKAIPTLFNKRLRVEKMGMANLRQVVIGTTAAAGVTLEHGEATAQRIIDGSKEPRIGVQLSYLQVYLDKLYRNAARGADGSVVFTDALIAETGAFGDVMADFLEEQTESLQAALAARFPGLPKDAVQRILEEFATLEGTKQPTTRAELGERMPGYAPAILDAALAAFETGRIVRNADGVYELAHDTLAGRVAERRGGKSKNLMKVKKLVRDRMAAFEQTKSLLNAEELVIVSPHIGDLTAGEAGFVQRSADMVRRARRRRILVTAGTIASLALAFLLALAGLYTAGDTIDTATQGTEDLVQTIYQGLEPIPNTRQVTREILKQAMEVNRTLTGDESSNDSNTFWLHILDGDEAVDVLIDDKSDKAASDRAEARARKSYATGVALAERMVAETGDDEELAGYWRGNVEVAQGRLMVVQSPEDGLKTALLLQAGDEARLRDNPDDRDYQAIVIDAYDTTANMALAAGQPTPGLAAARKATVLCKAVLAKPGKEAPFSACWADSYVRLSELLTDDDEAIAVLQEWIAEVKAMEVLHPSADGGMSILEKPYSALIGRELGRGGPAAARQVFGELARGLRGAPKAALAKSMPDTDVEAVLALLDAEIRKAGG